MLTATLIKRFAPSARADIVAGLVEGWPAIYAAGITKPKRLQHFMAEMAVESMGFVHLEENLNYSAARLCQVWPKRFPTLVAAAPYARNPEALAEKVYGGRMGNTLPGDGWKHRGSGLLQTTGKDNFRDAGFADDPGALRAMPGALTAALRFWNKNGLNALVDAGDLTAERKRVNGGTNGLADLKLYVASAGKIFVKIVPPAAPTTVVASRAA